METSNTKLTGAPDIKTYVCSDLQKSQLQVQKQEITNSTLNVSPVFIAALDVSQNHHNVEITKPETTQVTSLPSTLKTTTIAHNSPASLNLPPPTPNITVTGSTGDVALLNCLLPAPPQLKTANIRATPTPPLQTGSNSTAPPTLTTTICASDFDSDTELSIVAASTAENSVTVVGVHSTTPPVQSVPTSTCLPALAVLEVTSNGHNKNTYNSSQISLNTKQQRQQKRRRERAQRLQAERDSRCNSGALSGAFVGGSLSVAVSLGMVTTSGGSNGSIISAAPGVIMGSNSVLGPGNAMLYHLNSAGSMGEDSNNSNGNFTSSSNGSNNLLPPTDSIASLLLNPPHSPECNSGLMATPSDSEGESLDEDLLSTSSSSTLLLPRDKPPPRPPPPVRRKLPRSPVLEEEIIDGFAILEFKTYEDLEFAIKLGQKRKEKRLSALEELTCTYSIEEMKMPKIIDTGQPLPHTLRNTNLSSLSIASNNLKEVNHHARALTIGNAVVVTPNSGNISNNISNSNCNSAYTVPLASMCTAPDSEAGVAWRGDQYRQQQSTVSSCNKNNISINMNRNANHSEISNNKHISSMGESNQVESSVSNCCSSSISETVHTNSNVCLSKNGNEKQKADSSCQSPLPVNVVHHEDLNSVGNSKYTDVQSQKFTINANEPNSDSTKYVDIKGSSDTITANTSLSVLHTPSACQKIKKRNTFETSKREITSALGMGSTLEINDFADRLSHVVEDNILLKKNPEMSENFTDIPDHCSSNEKVSNICDKPQCEKMNPENVSAFDFSSTQTNVNVSPIHPVDKASEYFQEQSIITEPASGDTEIIPSVEILESRKSPVLNILTSANSVECLTVINKNGSNGSPDGIQKNDVTNANVSSTNTSAECKDNPLSLSSADNNLLDVKMTHSILCPQVKSLECDSHLASTSGRCRLRPISSATSQEVILSTTVVTSVRPEAVEQRPSSSLFPGTPLTPVSATQLKGSSFIERASSVLVSVSGKPTDKSTIRNEASLPIDLQNSAASLLPMPSTSVANGFLTAYPSISCASSAVLSCISPQSGGKLHSVSMDLPSNTSNNSVASAASSTTKTSFNAGSSTCGSAGSLVFHSASPSIPHLNAGLPMLIQATPYRTPYTNYSLYSPFNSVSHGQYLPSILPIVAPNTLTSSHRYDSRACRDPPITTSLKAPISSTTTSQQHNVNGISGLRPVTPLGFVITSNAACHTVSAVPSTPSSTVQVANSSHPHNLSTYTGAFGVSTTVPVISTATLSVPAVTSVTVTPQLLPTTQTQLHSQSGYPSHLPQLLTSYPQFAQPTQHQSIPRCSTNATMGITNTPVVTVPNFPTAMSTSSINVPITTSSSMIKKILSPKSENASRDRDINYSTFTNARPNASGVGGSQCINLGQQFCSLTPSAACSGASVPLSTTLSTSSHSVLAVTGPSLATFSPKTGLWLNTSVMPASAATTTPIVSASNIRVTHSPLTTGTTGTPSRAVTNAISPHAVHSSTGSGHVPVANFQTAFFATPVAPPHSASTTSSITSISSNSMGLLPLVSNTSAIVATMTTATTTSPSVITVGTTQSSVPTVSSTVIPTPHPFSAESLFQPSKNDQADLLRRELDSRFLDRTGLSQPPPTSSSTYLRQEFHHHQHTHLHQHPQMISTTPMSAANSIMPQTPPTPAQIFPPPLFKDISKVPGVETQFYRSSIGYTGYSSAGILHPGLGGPTPFMPPNHVNTFAPKKTGRWNAMHVRIAWEIYYHQNKQSSDKSVCNSSNVSASHSGCSTSSNLATSITTSTGSGTAPGSIGITANNTTIGTNGNAVAANASSLCIKSSSALTLRTTSPHSLNRSGELLSASTYGRSSFETSTIATSFLGSASGHIGTSVSPFGRYVGSFGFGGLTHFGRDISLGGHLETWRTSSLPRSVAYHPTVAAGPNSWVIKTDPSLENARRESEDREREIREREQRERERQRREREERERKEKEEKLKREQQERERERERKERERREIERREIERDRLLQQHRINESNKHAAASAVSSSTSRDRSPHRSISEHTEVRIKEEHPRTKEEQEVMLMRVSAGSGVADPRYHSHPSSLVVAQTNAAVAAAHHHANFLVTGRHGSTHGLPSSASHLSRSMIPPTLAVGGPLTHFTPSGPSTWGMDPYRDPYAPLRYIPIMEAAFRHEAEERHKVLSIYAAQSAAHLRGKEPSPIPPPSVGPLGSPAIHLRMQPPPGINIIASSPVPPPSQASQTQLPTIGIVKPLGQSQPTMNIAVQHFIAPDSLSRSPITTKKDPDHTMGLVGSTPGAGVSHGTISSSVIGVPSASPVTPSR